MALDNLLTHLITHLIHRIDNQMAMRFTREAKKYGINAQAWRILSALLERDDQRVGELARNTAIELSTLSHFFKGMGRDGLIKRRRIDDDQRSVEVFLTPAGRALTEKVAPLGKAHEQAALAGFSEDEAQTLKALLKRVADNINAQDNRRVQDDAPGALVPPASEADDR